MITTDIHSVFAKALPGVGVSLRTLLVAGATFAVGLSFVVPSTAKADCNPGHVDCPFSWGSDSVGFDSGWGSDSVGFDSGGYSDWSTYDNVIDDWSTYDNSFSNDWSTYDNSYFNDWSTYDNSFSNDWSTYDNSYNSRSGYYGSYRNYYQQPYRTNYYDYYSTPSYNYSYNPPSYNNNENTNVNNNNVHVNVDNGGNNHDNRSCSDFGQIGNYPNCRNRDNNNDDDEPSCDLNASDTSVDEGDDIILEWDTEDADYASINQGIGRVDEDGGDIRVEIEDNDDVTFRMTVRDNDGDEDTCSVTIRVDEDNNNDFSSVSFDSGPVSNPPVVYLSDLPYTGIEDITPSMIGFWATLAALIGIGGYFVFFKRSKVYA